MNRTLLTLATAAALLVALNVGAAASGQATPTIKRVPVPYTSGVSGSEMFEAYCASCHGKDGNGNGPAGPALKTPVPDLTRLAASHGGTFPSLDGVSRRERAREALHPGTRLAGDDRAHGRR